jgi:hypothetical protein
MKNKMEFKNKKPLKKNSPSPGVAKRASLQSKGLPANHITYLQRTIGNQAVQRLLKSGTLQAKLEIGKAGDKYEKEADRVADIVMRMPKPVYPVSGEKEGIRRQPEEEEELQAKPIAEQITPLVQRQEEEPEEEEEEPVQTKPADDVVLQRQEEEPEEEEEPIQTKPVAEGITPEVQRQEEEPEEEEEEESIQTKSNGSIAKINPGIESSINSIKESGQPLSKSARNYFEPRFGYDFSGVRVHTDNKASETAKSINAKAFTKGRNIVFGAGQYAPETNKGKTLLAHELTHVVQQNVNRFGQSNKLQRAVKFKADFENISLKKASGASISVSTYNYQNADFSADAKIVATGDTNAELNQWDVGVMQDQVQTWDRYYWQRTNTDGKGSFVEKKYKPINTRFRDQLGGSTTVWCADSEHQLLSGVASAPKGTKFQKSTTVHTSDVPQGPETVNGSSVPGMDASDGTRNIKTHRTGARFDTYISARNTVTGAWRHLRRLNWNFQRSLDFTGKGATLAVGPENVQLGKHGPYSAGKNAPLTTGKTYNTTLNDNASWYFRRVKGWT